MMRMKRTVALLFNAVSAMVCLAAGRMARVVGASNRMLSKEGSAAWLAPIAVQRFGDWVCEGSYLPAFGRAECRAADRRKGLSRCCRRRVE